jgi:hypothetical protein
MRTRTLLRIKSVVDEYKRHQHPGVSSAFIWRHYIDPVFHISLSSLYEYLATPVDKLLKERGALKDEQDPKQLKLKI